MVAPEWMVGKAWSDFRAVCSIEAEFAEWSKKDGVPWVRKHSYFANMGGFSITFAKLQARDSATPTSPSSPRSAGGSAATIDACQPQVAKPVEEVGTVAKLQARDSETPTSPTSARGAAVTIGECQSQAIQSVEEDETKIDTALVREKVAESEATSHGSDAVPGYIKDALAREIRRSQRRPNAYTYQPRFNIGEAPWREDAKNASSAEQIISTLNLSHFEDDWERQRFSVLYRSWLRNLRRLQQDTWILDANQLLLARQLGIIERLPHLTEDDLDDRNKADDFVKAVAICQMAWFAAQLGLRVSLRVPTSQLEIMTFASAICTVITYFLLRDKPKDARYSILVAADRCATPCRPYVFRLNRYYTTRASTKA
ncbi:hypothetical protein V2A60_004090 [Cordyceps javanica]